MKEIFSKKLDYSAGLTGCRVISGTSPVVGGFQGFLVNDDAVVSSILDKDGIDVTSALGLSAFTLKQGTFVSIPAGNCFSSITLASGSVIAYITIGVPGSVAAAPFVGLLDTYTGAAVAYSVRKLRAAYAGSAMRVRRSSDNTEEDIGFDANGNLDESALTTFVGAGNGFVTTWYDQSGNSRNATQSTAVNQPQIVSSGVVIKQNNKAAMNFDGSNDSLRTINFSLVQPENLFFVHKWLAINKGAFTFQYMIDGFSSDTMVYREVGGKINVLADTVLYNNTQGANLNQNLSSVLFNGSNSNYYLNNSLIASGNAGSLSGGGISIGLHPSLGRWGNFSFQELIVYGSNQNTNRSGINSNINTYFSIY